MKLSKLLYWILEFFVQVSTCQNCTYSQKIISKKSEAEKVQIYMKPVETCTKNTRISQNEFMGYLKFAFYPQKSSIRQKSSRFRYSLKPTLNFPIFSDSCPSRYIKFFSSHVFQVSGALKIETNQYLVMFFLFTLNIKI